MQQMVDASLVGVPEQYHADMRAMALRVARLAATQSEQHRRDIMARITDLERQLSVKRSEIDYATSIMAEAIEMRNRYRTIAEQHQHSAN